MDPFASPSKFDPELLSFLEKASRSLCQWFSETSENSPIPAVREFPQVEPSQKSIPPENLLSDLQQIMQGAYRPSHPGALAHLDPPPLTASIVADLICSGLNNNLLADELSPSLSKLERELCYWIAFRLGMTSSSGGVAASGGTLSNLMALVIARKDAGLCSDPSAVVLSSADAHVSLLKAAAVMGLQSDSLRQVSTDDFGRICISALKSELAKLKIEGRKCFAIVATAGTTIRGAVDPIYQISKLAVHESIWLHVDGSIGAVFSLSSGTSEIVKDLKLADSVSLNPQKLLGVSKTSSVLILADKNHLKSTFSTGLPYFEPLDLDESHCGETGLQGTRSAEILKLWLGFRQLGEKGIDEVLSAAINRKNYFIDKLDSSIYSIIHGPLHLIAFTPKGFSREQSLKWSKRTRQLLLKKKFMLSRPIHHGRYYLKAVFGNPHTEFSHLDELAYILNHSVSLDPNG